MIPADSISTLNAAEAVRFRPKLYFKDCFNSNSLSSLPVEALCHALDENVDARCTKIEIILYQNNRTVISYNADMSLALNDEGITLAERILTQIFACKNEKKHLEVGQEFCKVGIATLNFVSENFTLRTANLEQEAYFHFNKGILKEKVITNSKRNTPFTIIDFTPDKEIFGELNIQKEELENKIKRLKKDFINLSISTKYL